MRLFGTPNPPHYRIQELRKIRAWADERADHQVAVRTARFQRRIATLERKLKEQRALRTAALQERNAKHRKQMAELRKQRDAKLAELRKKEQGKLDRLQARFDKLELELQQAVTERTEMRAKVRKQKPTFDGGKAWIDSHRNLAGEQGPQTIEIMALLARHGQVAVPNYSYPKELWQYLQRNGWVRFPGEGMRVAELTNNGYVMAGLLLGESYA